MIEPAVGIAGDRLDHRRPVQVEDAAALCARSSRLGDQPVLDHDRQARRPCHLLDRRGSGRAMSLALSFPTAGSRASTLEAGQISPVGAKMYCARACRRRNRRA